MKSLTAIAIVSKKNPRLKVNEIYSKKDSKDIRVGKDEKKIEVVIMAK